MATYRVEIRQRIEPDIPQGLTSLSIQVQGAGGITQKPLFATPCTTLVSRIEGIFNLLFLIPWLSRVTLIFLLCVRLC